MEADNVLQDMIDLHNFFSKTKWGEKLEGRIRYGRYKPSYWTDEKWVKVLGIDVNNLSHLLRVLFATKIFLETEKKFNEREKFLLMLSAVTHDWGEAIVGDIISDLKTDSQEKKEEEQFLIITQYVLRKYKGGKYFRDTGRIASIIFSSDFFSEEDARIGFIFKNIIENSVAIFTALRAWGAVKKYPRESSLLQWIVVNVFAYLPEIIKNAPDSLYLRKIFEERKHVISEIFASMPSEVFDHYNYDLKEKRAKKIMFKEARVAWFASIYPR